MSVDDCTATPLLWINNNISLIERKNQQTFSINQITKTACWFERIESDFNALNSFTPSVEKVNDTCPLELVVFPFTSAPATGLPLCPFVTIRNTVEWRVVTFGPVSFKNCVILKALNANRIWSLSLTSCWQPPTGMSWKLRSKFQNAVDVWVFPPMEVMRKSSNSVKYVL